jgi:hypothetical protein
MKSTLRPKTISRLHLIMNRLINLIFRFDRQLMFDNDVLVSNRSLRFLMVE